MKTITRSLLFLFINFVLVLYVGNVLMGNGATSEWYLNLQKAPWTPDGWVFGAAWTSIMICFSIYLLYFFTKKYTRKKLLLFIIQVLLNVSWNYIFFNQQQVLFALIIITLLTALIFYKVPSCYEILFTTNASILNMAFNRNFTKSIHSYL